MRWELFWGFLLSLDGLCGMKKFLRSDARSTLIFVCDLCPYDSGHIRVIVSWKFDGKREISEAMKRSSGHYGNLNLVSHAHSHSGASLATFYSENEMNFFQKLYIARNDR